MHLHDAAKFSFCINQKNISVNWSGKVNASQALWILWISQGLGPETEKCDYLAKSLVVMLSGNPAKNPTSADASPVWWLRTSVNVVEAVRVWSGIWKSFRISVSGVSHVNLKMIEYTHARTWTSIYTCTQEHRKVNKSALCRVAYYYKCASWVGRAHGIGPLVHLPIVFTLIWIEKVWQELSYQYYECLTQSCFPHPSKKCMHRPPAGDSPKHPSICLYMRDHHVTLWRRPPSTNRHKSELQNIQTRRQPEYFRFGDQHLQEQSHDELTPLGTAKQRSF